MQKFKIIGKKLVPIPPTEPKKSSPRNKVTITKSSGVFHPDKRVCIVRSVGGIGDLLMSTPIAKQLKHDDPGVYISFAVSYQYLRGCLPEILKNNPYIDDIIPYNKVVKENYSRVIDLSVIRNIYETPNSDPLNKIDLYSNRAGIQLSDKLPIYVVSSKEKEWADDFLSKKFDERRYLIGVQMESKAIRRTWDKSYKFVKELAKRNNVNIIAFTLRGGVKFPEKNVFVTENMNIRRISALIDKCDLLVTADSGIMHIAGALNKKMICLFGPTHPESRANYYPRAKVIWHQEECHKSPCWYMKCKNDYRCIKSISMDEVMNLVNSEISSRDSKRLRYYGNPKKKIAWINESDMQVQKNRKVWGAETSSQTLINHGIMLGYDIYHISPYRFDFTKLKESDLLVVNSIERFNNDQTSKLTDIIFNSGIPYIMYNHDYGFCPHRNQIKCNGHRGLELDCEKYVNKFGHNHIEFYRRLFDRAKSNFFISQPHRDVHYRAYGDVIDPSYIITPPVDPSTFSRIDRITRDPKLIICTAGRLNSWNKGWENIKSYIQEHPEYKYELYTHSSSDIENFVRRNKNVSLFKPVESKYLPRLYSRASKLLCLPANVEPCGRTPVEAALCGCEIVTNENVGASYFPFTWNNPNKLSIELSQGIFNTWREISRIIG